MVQIANITAERRERAGKGAARATRRAGRVPGVIYGNRMPPENISLDPVALMQQVRRPGFFSRVFEIAIGSDKVRALARDLQTDPVSDRPTHVDFMRFGADTPLRVGVQVIFVNDSKAPGLKRGGVLNVVRHEVEVICVADKIPETLTVDLSGLDIGDSVHISAVALPEGVRPAISDRDFTIATIAAPSRLETEEELAAAAAAAAAAAEAAAAGVTPEGGAAPGAAGAPAADAAKGGDAKAAAGGKAPAAAKGDDKGKGKK